MQTGIRSWHPMVIFWLGLLTGALIVTVLFLFKYLEAVDYKAALLKYLPGYKITNTYKMPAVGNSVNPYGIGDPPGY